PCCSQGGPASHYATGVRPPGTVVRCGLTRLTRGADCTNSYLPRGSKCRSANRSFHIPPGHRSCRPRGSPCGGPSCSICCWCSPCILPDLWVVPQVRGSWRSSIVPHRTLMGTEIYSRIHGIVRSAS